MFGRRPKPRFLCLNCRSEIEAEYVWEGSLLVAVILTLMLVLPGLVYLMWRRLQTFPVCPVCGSRRLRRGHMTGPSSHRRGIRQGAE